MTRKKPKRTRSAELKRRLEDSQAQLVARAAMLTRRAERGVRPGVLLRQHPLLVAAVSSVLAYGLVRRPKWLGEAARRAVATAIPYVASIVVSSIRDDR